MDDNDFIRRSDIVYFLRESAEGLVNTPSWASLLNECADKIEQGFDNFPSADVEPVVRCRDCRFGTREKNYEGKEMIECWNPECPCSYHAYLLPQDWYCADGKQREVPDAT